MIASNTLWPSAPTLRTTSSEIEVALRGSIDNAELGPPRKKTATYPKLDAIRSSC
jgi:hypothetical protein